MAKNQVFANNKFYDKINNNTNKPKRTHKRKDKSSKEIVDKPECQKKHQQQQVHVEEHTEEQKQNQAEERIEVDKDNKMNLRNQVLICNKVFEKYDEDNASLMGNE